MSRGYFIRVLAAHLWAAAGLLHAQPEVHAWRFILDEDVFLAAVRQKESRDNPKKIGRKGERSAYQFLRITWIRYTNEPFERATTDPELADRVARKHLRTIASELRDRRLETNSVFYAMAWNFGEHADARHAASDYAQQLNNLYLRGLQEKGPAR